MITKNYKLYCYARCIGLSTAGFVSVEGTAYSYYPQNSAAQANRGDFGYALDNIGTTALKNSSNACVRVGSGSTPPTENDYNLETPITSGLIVSGAMVRDPECRYVQGSYALMNTSDADITINEIGYFGAIASSSSDNAGKCVLMERTVFPEPIVIPPGGVESISYRVDLYNW